MGTDLERQRGWIAGIEIMFQRGLHHRPERRERRPCSYRIGRVGCDQKRRMLATTDSALETAGYFNAKKHLARLQEIIKFRNLVHFAGETEISRIFERL